MNIARLEKLYPQKPSENAITFNCPLCPVHAVGGTHQLEAFGVSGGLDDATAKHISRPLGCQFEGNLIHGLVVWK